MTTQNLVSASITPETRAEVLRKLTEIRESLAFLLTLQPDEIRGIIKVSNSYSPFVDKAYSAVNSYPEIMAGVFDIDEFKRDYSLAKDLAAIGAMVDQLADGISNTILAANSDAMTGALEVYAAVKQNRDKVPGLNVVSDELGEFFRKGKKRSEEGDKQQ